MRRPALLAVENVHSPGHSLTHESNLIFIPSSFKPFSKGPVGRRQLSTWCIFYPDLSWLCQAGGGRRPSTELGLYPPTVPSLLSITFVRGDLHLWTSTSLDSTLEALIFLETVSPPVPWGPEVWLSRTSLGPLPHCREHVQSCTLGPQHSGLRSIFCPSQYHLWLLFFCFCSCFILVVLVPLL